MKHMVSLLLSAGIGLASAFAQNPDDNPNNPQNNEPEDSAQPNRFWQASLAGGHYMVALERISAVSRHEYLLNGNLVVDEVTVDSLGQALVRFYFIRPLTETMAGTSTGATAARIAGRAQEAIGRATDLAGTHAHEMVVKTYPDTTHARTIEYRVQSAQHLTALYNSLRTAWESGKGRRFRGR